MSINKYISYLVCNKGIIVNLYKLNFPSFHFFSQTKQKSFSPSHFSTPPTKHTRGKTKYFPSSHFSILPQFSTLPIFHSSNQTKPNDLLKKKNKVIDITRILFLDVKVNTRKKFHCSRTTNILKFKIKLIY